MRNPLSRLTFILRLVKPKHSSMTTTATDSRSLAQFLSNSKEKYLNDIRASPSRGDQWTVVMGNEAGDLDSLASSIAFAWVQSEVHKKPTIPLLQLERDDLYLRAENIHALNLAGLTDPKDQLLYLNDIPSFSPFPSKIFALVDHNTLASRYTTSNPLATVTAIIDHHEDDGNHNAASPRTIVPCGSCSSHIAALCTPDIPPTLGSLLLSAILIDTGGLKPGGKAVDIDFQAANFLVPHSTLASSLSPQLLDTLQDNLQTLYSGAAIRELTRVLLEKKGGISHLSGRDLLRRDYKEYIYDLPGGREVKAGLASIPVGLKAWAKNGVLESASVEWMAERETQVLGVLTSFRGGSKAGKEGRGKHKRQMAWIVYDRKSDVADLASKLWKELEESDELRLKKHKKFDLEKKGRLPKGAQARVYRQGNVEATRKAIAPLLKRILEARNTEAVANSSVALEQPVKL